MKRYRLLDDEGKRKWRGDVDKLRVRRRHGKQRRLSVLVVGSHTEAEWQAVVAKQKGRCTKCAKKVKLTRDHIVPWSKGGSDYIVNIQGLCLSCNCSKQASLEGVVEVSLFERLTA